MSLIQQIKQLILLPALIIGNRLSKSAAAILSVKQIPKIRDK